MFCNVAFSFFDIQSFAKFPCLTIMFTFFVCSSACIDILTSLIPGLLFCYVIRVKAQVDQTVSFYSDHCYTASLAFYRAIFSGPPLNFLSTRSHVNWPQISLSARGYIGILYLKN